MASDIDKDMSVHGLAYNLYMDRSTERQGFARRGKDRKAQGGLSRRRRI